MDRGGRLAPWLVAAALLYLVACDLLPTPIPSPPTPSSEPSPEHTITPIVPTPTPDGVLPSVLAEVDLGLPAGDSYWPVAAAVGENNLAYVVCQHCETPTTGPSCLSLIDLESGTVRAVWPLPGTSIGPLAAGGGRLYVVYRRDQLDRLAVFDSTTGEVVQDTQIGFVGYQGRLWLDVSRSRLYLPLAEGIEVRDAMSLTVVGTLRYPFVATDRHVVCDPESDRLYISLSSVIYAYQASDLTLSWRVEAPTERIASLLVDASGKLLLAQGISTSGDRMDSRIFLYGTEGGEVLHGFAPDFGDQSWKLAWADAEADRVAYQGAVYSPGRPTQLRLWSTDTQGHPTGDSALLGDGTSMVLGRQPMIYVLDQASHELAQVEGVNLAVALRVQVGIELQDLAVDHARQRLYVNDTASRLYEFDTVDLMRGMLRLQRSSVAGSGSITINPENRLLLVSRAGGDGSRVSVVDLDTLQVTQVITGGDRVAVDTRRARAIVGSRSSAYPGPSGENQVWDLASNKRIGAIDRGGPPAYNPLRDEIYIGGHSCHAYDAATLAHIGSLTPDIDAQECEGCTGQPAVVDVSTHPSLNALALHMVTTSAGKGPGLLPPPRLFALDTLAPLTHTLTYLSTCRDTSILWPPMAGRVYENMLYSRYVARANAVVWDADTGEVVSWRDGLALEMVTPDGRLAFARRDDRWLSLNTEDWAPLGYTSRYCIHDHDRQLDVFYAMEGPKLYVILPRWGPPLSDLAPRKEAAKGAVRAVHISPGYGEDQTIFAVSENALFRSRTSGEEWERLDGGIPRIQHPEEANLFVALSPDHLRDRTLFAGGWDGGGQGLGVWRSTDGGDTWQPMWRGLTHLRVEKIVLSPDYATDGVLVAYCRYDDLKIPESGWSVFRSSDRGEQWELMQQLSEASGSEEALPEPEELLPELPKSPPLRAAGTGRGVEARTGDAWTQVLSLPQGQLLVAQVPSPHSIDDGAAYILAELSLYRSRDDGSTWEVASGQGLEGGESDQRFTALAAGADLQGNTILVLGDSLGQVTIVRADGLAWTPFSASR